MNNSIDIQISSRINKNERFAIYHLPGEAQCTLVDFTKPKPFFYDILNESPVSEGFVVFPFDELESSGWWFSPSDTLTMTIDPMGDIPNNKPEYRFDETHNGFEEYASQFSILMDSLIKGEVKKVILSRVIHINLSLKKQLSGIFQLLCRQYPGAFAYLMSTPETGIWIGASPELLLKKKEKEFTTVALAGTQNLNEMDPGNWNSKELEEQNVVSNYIDRLLEKYNIGNFQKSGPAITRAGSVTHLKTTYQFSVDAIPGKAGSFLKEMHPTPALGGEPKKTALDLIRKVEKHQRHYYGGFLGPVSQQEINLYVNIRCMKINSENIDIYVGGGLIPESKLDQEWNETILKSQTLLSVINNFKEPLT